jgi:6-phosphogluconolactonase (cycloisomerase 2 family)
LLSLCLIAALLSLLAACGSSACGGANVSSTGGGASGGGTSASSTCGSSSSGGGGTGNTGAVDFIYSTVDTNINGAYYNGTDLLTLSGFISPNLGSGGAVDMIIVNNKFLYQPWAPASGSSVVYGYMIDQSQGGLTAVTGSPYTTAAVADSLATDPGSRFLFLGQTGTFTISVMQINSSTGALTPAPGSPFSLNGLAAQQIAVDTSGKYLYATISNIGSGLVIGFSIDQTTGALTPLPNSPYFVGLDQVVAVPGSEFLIGSGSGQLEVVSINPTTGDLTAGATLSPVIAPSGVIVHPNGKFAYTFNQALASLEGFSFNSTTGALTELPNSPFTGAQALSPAKIDPNGTSIIGLTTTTAFGLDSVDPTTGAVTSPTNPPSLNPGSTYFGVIN